MSQTNLISIIMPLYNCEEFVEESINSVISQTYENWELIVVDDCSTDNSYQKVKYLAENDNRIKLYQMPTNSGVARVRNKAISVAKGRYLAFLDADDLWHSDKLKIQLEFMLQNSLDFSFTAFDVIDESGKTSFGVNEVPLKFRYKDLLKHTAIGCLTVMYDTFKLDKCYFDISLGKHEDYQCWLEILKKIPYAGGLNEPLAYYRVRNSSLSSNKLIAASYVWKIIYRYQKIPFLKALYYFSNYAFKAVLKHKIRKN
jgi:glycosyltransferase involved in cell wall biosynthesis